MLRRLICGGAMALLAATTPVTLPAQGGVAAGDWSTYNRTVAGDRFSPPTEITRANVGQLREVCRYALPEVTSLQTGPIVIAGVLYFTTDTISYAVDAASCAEQWKYVRQATRRTRSPCIAGLPTSAGGYSAGHPTPACLRSMRATAACSGITPSPTKHPAC